MIDLNDAQESTTRARAAIAVLRTALDILENCSVVAGRADSSEPLATPAAPVVATAPAMVCPDQYAAPTPPPPPPGPLLVSEDPEIEPDGDDAAPDHPEPDPAPVTSLTTTVTLPPAPPASGSPVPPPPPIPAPPGPAVAAELDTRGYPWDARIHAANRAKTIKGAWKNKRGVDPALVASVEGAAGSVTVLPAAAPAAPPAAPVNLPATAPVASSIPAAPGTIGFRELMQKIQTATAAGKLTTEQVNAALATVGLQPLDMPLLVGNPGLIAGLNAAIDERLA